MNTHEQEWSLYYHRTNTMLIVTRTNYLIVPLPIYCVSNKSLNMFVSMFSGSVYNKNIEYKWLCIKNYDDVSHLFLFKRKFQLCSHIFRSYDYRRRTRCFYGASKIKPATKKYMCKFVHIVTTDADSTRLDIHCLKKDGFLCIIYK